MRRNWERLKSGLYVPPFLKRLHRDQRGLWYPCCNGNGGVSCPGCIDKAPLQWKVVIDDVIDEDCANCQLYNATWYPDFVTAGPYSCLWSVDGVGDVCPGLGDHGNPVRMQVLTGIAGGKYYLMVQPTMGTSVGGPGVDDWYYEQDTAIDCLGIRNFDMTPYYRDSEPQDACDITGASCTISAS